MGFCKICRSRKKPGMHIKIVVNLKKDTICPSCEKHFDIKAHKRKRDKKLVIFILRLHVEPDRHNRARRLLLPLVRESHDRPHESGWLDMEIPGGDDMDYNWLVPRTNLYMDVGNSLPWHRCHRILQVET